MLSLSRTKTTRSWSPPLSASLRTSKMLVYCFTAFHMINKPVTDIVGKIILIPTVVERIAVMLNFCHFFLGPPKLFQNDDLLFYPRLRVRTTSYCTSPTCGLQESLARRVASTTRNTRFTHVITTTHHNNNNNKTSSSTTTRDTARTRPSTTTTTVMIRVITTSKEEGMVARVDTRRNILRVIRSRSDTIRATSSHSRPPPLEEVLEVAPEDPC